MRGVSGTDALVRQAARVMRDVRAADDLPTWAADALASPPQRTIRPSKPKAVKAKSPRPPKVPKPVVFDYPRRPRGRPPKAAQPATDQTPAPPRKRGPPPLRVKPVPKACIRCGVVKHPRAFHRSRTAPDGRVSCCRACIALRRRASRIARLYPACAALGVQNAKGGLRSIAREWGFDSGVEVEVAALFDNWGVDVAREGTTYPYLDQAGQWRSWRPDFTTPTGTAIEVKGRVFPGACAKIEAVLAQHPDLDLRLVFQDPFQHVSKGGPTHAEWADGLDLRWTTPAALGLVTMDLPRLALTNDGDKVIPDHCDDGRAAQRKSYALWPPAAALPALATDERDRVIPDVP